MAKALTVDQTLTRLVQLAEELRSLRGELCDHVFASQEPVGSDLFHKSGESVEAMKQLKVALDDVRHLVWLYLESLDEHPVPGPDRQRRLLARATEILGAVSQRPPLPTPFPNGGERSFVDRLLHLIERLDPQPPVTKEHVYHSKS